MAGHRDLIDVVYNEISLARDTPKYDNAAGKTSAYLRCSFLV